MHAESAGGSPFLSKSSPKSSLTNFAKQVVPGYEKRIRSFVNWSSLQESYIEHLANYQKGKYSGSSFHDALNSKIKSSSFYNFMGDFHCTIKAQNYLEIMQMTLWDLEKFGSEEEVFDFIRSNNITDSIEDVIKKSVKDKTSLNFDWLQSNVELLRLMNYQVTTLDSSLKQFKGIKCLNLSLNYLSNFKGRKLPKQLQMLELQGNFITNVLSLSQSLPESLAYLGISRNLISDDNHYLMALNTTNISVLDLSDNEIDDLKEVLSVLSNVKTLFSLSLDGNPCSFCQIYKDTVVSYIPRLGFLDGIEIEEDDKNPDFNLEGSHENLFTSGEFVFSCYRVMALPEPIPDKATIKMYFLEVTLPLLDDVLKDFIKYNNVNFYHLPGNKKPEPSVLVYDHDNQMSFSSDNFYDDTKQVPNYKESISDTVSTDVPRPDSDAEIHISPPLQLDEIFKKQRLKTVKEPWKKVIEFDIPSIKIPCDDLRMLRDVFRSKVTVNLICASINPAVLKIPKAKSNTGKKDSKMSQMKVADTASDECILDRETVASFHCHLVSPKWKTPCLDFQWTEHVNSEDANITQGLEGLKYPNDSVKTPAAKGKKAAIAIVEENVYLEPPLEIPEELTCHIGFGVSRIK